MEWVETTGRTVDEAKEAALDQLGVDEQDAEFEVVEEARFGLFGRLRSEARVRARVRPTKPRPKEERRERRGRRRPGAADSSGSETTDERAKEAPGSAGGERAGLVAPKAPASPRGGASAADGATVAAPPRRRHGSPRGPGRDGQAQPEAGSDTESRSVAEALPAARDEDRSDVATSPGGGMDVSLEEQAEVAKDFLVGLTSRMNLEAEVDVAQPEEETVELNLQGQDLGLLIGPKGSTLLAMQDVTRTVVQRKTGAGNGRILVDVAGYRRKRKDALARFSRQVAEEVQASGSRRVLEPMSAADRKVVHDTVNQIDGVTTISEGEDPRRRVVIVPSSASN
ncbi:MAG TPA: RNA-binding cell elongation regulator Jag/EloR [Acidimicrobiales bacterium]|nr:RNA-binding cell elongation regulator Jag/EloR [Acidimicrobiales bacterium]